MPNLKRRVPRMLSDAQEAAVQASIANDPDNPELTDEQAARMRSASEVLPPAVYAALTRPRGRPKLAEPKESIKLRINPKTIARFRASGPGWQTKMNDVLTEASLKLGQFKEPVKLEVKRSPTRISPRAKVKRIVKD